jgi:hypothetical protein
MFNNYEEYSSQEIITEELSEKLARLSEERLLIEDHIASLEEELEKTKEQLKTNESVITSLLGTLEGKIKLPNGKVLEVASMLRGSINKERQLLAYKWLEDNGHSSLMKRQLEIQFSREQVELAQKVKEYLAQADFGQPVQVDLNNSVHHSTFDAFVRKHYEQGLDLPAELFSVYTQKLIKVK